MVLTMRRFYRADSSRCKSRIHHHLRRLTYPQIIHTLFIVAHFAIASPRRILDAVERVTGVSEEQIASGSRVARLVSARRIAAFLLADLAGASPAEIATIFHRDRATVIYTLARCRAIAAIDQEYAKHLLDLKVAILTGGALAIRPAAG